MVATLLVGVRVGEWLDKDALCVDFFSLFLVVLVLCSVFLFFKVVCAGLLIGNEGQIYVALIVISIACQQPSNMVVRECGKCNQLIGG